MFHPKHIAFRINKRIQSAKPYKIQPRNRRLHFPDKENDFANPGQTAFTYRTLWDSDSNINEETVFDSLIETTAKAKKEASDSKKQEWSA